jgi:hypothetical protein
MSDEDDKGFRKLTEGERRLLERILAHHPFDGRDELLRQLESTVVRLISEYNDHYGSIELRVTKPIPASVCYRVPVEAEYPDDYGVPVWVLLHINRAGLMCELKICRADAKPFVSPRIPEKLEPFSREWETLIGEAKSRSQRRRTLETA